MGNSTTFIQETLRRRARSLAQRRTSELQETFEVVEFLLDNESYAFEPAFLKEVCSVSVVTQIPCTHPFVAGVLNLRGQIVTIINLKLLLGLSSPSVTVHNKAIILESGNASICFLADEIVGVRKELRSSLKPVPERLKGKAAEYFKGICIDRMVILDARKILSDKRLVDST